MRWDPTDWVILIFVVWVLAMLSVGFFKLIGIIS